MIDQLRRKNTNGVYAFDGISEILAVHVEGIISVDGIVGHLEEDTEHAFTYLVGLLVGYDYFMTSQAHFEVFG